MRRVAIKLVAVFIFPLLLWSVISFVFKPADYLFPSPQKVFITAVEQRAILFDHASVTIIEVIIGFIIANILSIILALVVSFFPKIEDSAVSLAVTLKTIPIIAVAPLLVLWFGSGIWSKIATVCMVCFFPALVNVLRGIKSLDQDLYGLFKMYSVNRFRLIRFFILPGITPYIFSALKVSSTLAVIGALVGEFISANRGLGFLIVTNYYSLNIAMVFACIVTSSIFGILLYNFIGYLERRCIETDGNTYL